MIYSVKVHERALKDFSKLEKPVKEQVLKRIKKLSQNSFALSERIKGFPRLSKVRAGDYRAIIEIKESKKEVFVLHVGHRSTVYEEIERFL